MTLHAKERRRDKEGRDRGEKVGSKARCHDRERENVGGATAFSEMGRLNECERRLAKVDNLNECKRESAKLTEDARL